MSNYDGHYHLICAAHMFGIYNWKQHSTGFLLLELRNVDWNYRWAEEYEEILRDVLSTRPHQSHKRHRNNNKHVNKSGACQTRRQNPWLTASY